MSASDLTHSAVQQHIARALAHCFPCPAHYTRESTPHCPYQLFRLVNRYCEVALTFLPPLAATQHNSLLIHQRQSLYRERAATARDGTKLSQRQSLRSVR